MTWILWVVVGLLVGGALVEIISIGRETKPTTPAIAAANVVFVALIVWAIIAIGIYR